MKHLRKLALGGLVAAFGGAALAGEAGDMVFADRGPWRTEPPLVWRLSQTGPVTEGFRPLGQGTLALTTVTDPQDGKPVLELAEDTARIKRRIGPFPTTGGDPTLTFFLETVARDMASLTGGSPFYIRNRLKDALFRGGEVRHEGDETVAVFAPFRGDPNGARMAGFDSLEMRFTMARPDAPIRAMTARTGPLAGGRVPYSHEMVMQ